MDRAERVALVTAGFLMAAFFGALVYSAAGLNILVPTCVTDVAPFTEGKIVDKGDQRYEVHVVAKMWAFDPAEVRLPPGSDVDVYLSALDVTHGMYIENTNVNLMAVPGSVNSARVKFDRPGEYRVICHEYCGAGHHFMMGKFIIEEGAAVPPLSAAAAIAGEVPAGESGEEIFEDNGCGACHSSDGASGVGPTLKGIAGRSTRLSDGTVITADDAYLERSIREPGAQIADGYQPIMPAPSLTGDQVRELVRYLKTLS